MSNHNPGSSSMIDQIFEQHFSSLGEGVYPKQREVIDSLLQGNNTLALMPTGSGKSLCYWIAGIALKGITLAVFPLTALMDEQALKLTNHGFNVLKLHAGKSAKKQCDELTALYQGREKPDFIFVSPERLATDGFLEFVLQYIADKIKLVVIDEAHCISQWGHDFRPFYMEIPQFLNNIFGGETNWPRLLAMTATLNKKDREQIGKDFHIKKEYQIEHDTLLRHEIRICVQKVPDEDTKDEEFWAFMEAHKDEKVLVYVDRKHRKRSTEDLSEKALERGFKATCFHGELNSNEKLAIIEKFKSGELLTVFATSAFGMGIDIPDIRGVVHYLLPESIEQFYQQIGRAGRDKQPAWSRLFYSDKNIDVRKRWYIEKSFPTEDSLQAAFENFTDGCISHKTVNYFNEDEDTQAAYHYLRRAALFSPLCKGYQRINQFKTKAIIPDYQTILSQTRTGITILTARNMQCSEKDILRDIYRWMGEGKLQYGKSPGKVMILDITHTEIPEETMQEMMAEAEEKKEYRHGLMDDFVELLETYQNSDQFHLKVGEYLGIDKYRMGKIHQTLSGDLVRSKSEVIIANILFERGIPFEYEKYLQAPDGSVRMPDFTITYEGKEYYWEHLGMLDNVQYHRNWIGKERWYQQHFSQDQLITTQESITLSDEAKNIALRFV